MNKLFLLLILSFFSAQGIAGSCPDGSEPVKSISEDGTYFVFNCEGGNKKASSSNTNINVGPVSINVHDEYQYNNFSGLVSLDFAFAIRTGFFGYHVCRGFRDGVSWGAGLGGRIYTTTLSTTLVTTFFTALS